jgi:diacylglycerol kinase family enzyme
MLAAEAAAAGARVVVALGGDGTANEVAAALAGGPAVIAIVPAGSTNVFARAIGWPAAPQNALVALAAALPGGATRPLVLGRLRAGSVDRVFCVNAGLGIDAEVVHGVETRPRLKRRLGQAAYAAISVDALARAARRAPVLRVTVDARAPVVVRSLVVVCASPYAWLGPRPLDLVPGPAHEGRLAWLGLLRARPTEIVRLGVRIVRGGAHLDHPALVHGRAERSIAVDAEPPVLVQADGEPLGWHSEAWLGPGPTVIALRPAVG